VYVRQNIRFKVVWRFARRPVALFTVLAVAVCLLDRQFQGVLRIPFLPISTLGIAVAFLIGFKNNSSYDRFWEARKIWGAIVNVSRTFATQVLTWIGGDRAVVTELVYRHLAWVNALRLVMRGQKDPDMWWKQVGCFVGTEEMERLLTKANAPTHLLHRQGERLAELARTEPGLSDVRHVEMMRLIEECYTRQGQCERIKNTPLPRQYAFFSTLFVWIFDFLLPFGLVGEFVKFGDQQGYVWMIWLTVPFSVLLSWVFLTMEMIGHYSENPFEGRLNEVPMTALSRTIEIDLKQMIGDPTVPPKLEPIDDILI
jgi:putative membrane protein